MTRGYYTFYGYFGFAFGRWLLFATEAEYYEYIDGMII